MLSYPRPPITEAVLQLNFGSTWDRKEIERCAESLGSEYQKANEMNVEFIVNPSGQISSKATPLGIRLTNPLLQQIVIIQPDAITFSRSAPYPGWDAFFGAGWEIFRSTRKKMGYRPITRAAVRYVNRIDIPHGSSNNRPKLEDYLRVHYSGPPILGMSAPNAYLQQADFHAPDGSIKVNIRVATQDPALIRHSSVLLDLDVFCDKALPQAEAELGRFFARLRTVKNDVFKACVTPAAEALFGAKP